MILPVVETFHSLQGEGYWQGTNAFFIRLGGCDVGCPWCDTKQSWPAQVHPRQAIEQLVAAALTFTPRLVIITGGEPLMHNLNDLTVALQAAGLRTHLETSGAHPLSGVWDWITLSPKSFKPPLPEIYAQASELKVVIATEADFAWAEQQRQHLEQATQIQDDIACYLQPEWSSDPGLIIRYIERHPNWRLSLQTHKYLQIR